MKVIIMRGLPGSGKSTYIKNNFPNALVCSADHFFEKDGEYNFNPAKLPDAHKACMRTFIKYLSAEAPLIIVDNTNTQLWELSPYVSVAEAFGAEVEILHVKSDVNTCIDRNVHGVPEKSIKAMNERWDNPLPWWNQKEV